MILIYFPNFFFFLYFYIPVPQDSTQGYRHCIVTTLYCHDFEEAEKTTKPTQNQSMVQLTGWAYEEAKHGGPPIAVCS